MIKKWLVLFFLIIFCFVSIPTTFAVNQNNIADSIDQIVQKYMKEGDAPGRALVVIQGGKLIYKKGYGYADKENQKPVTNKTKFYIGSLTKAYTGLGILKLIDENRIHLDDTVDKYLPWFQVIYRGETVDVTIRQLMEHSSGFSTESFINIPLAINLEQGVRGLVGSDLASRPGEKYNYSNTNFNILGLIIEKVSGQSFTAYLDKEIFRPLGMMDTEVMPTTEVAKGYKLAFFASRPFNTKPSLSQIPSGFLVTNIGDMEKWLSFHLNSTSQLKVKPVTLTEDNRFHYFGGWMFAEDKKSIYHEGNLPSYSGYTWLDQKNKIAVSVLANSNTSSNISLVNEIVSLLKKEKVQHAETDINRLTDRISSLLILGGLLWIAGMLRLIFIRINKMNKEKYQFKQTVFSKVASGVLLVLVLLLVYGSIQIPKLIHPVADWGYVYEWLPVTAMIAVVLLLIALLLSIIMVFLFMCFSQNRKTISK